MLLITVNRKVVASAMSAENGPENVVPSPVLRDLIYGDRDVDGGSLAEFLREGTHDYGQEFASKRADFWLELMRDTFTGWYCTNLH